MIVQGGLVRPVVDALRRAARAAGRARSSAPSASHLRPGATGAIFLAGVPVMALWGLAGPSPQAIMSRRVSASEQGQLQGANSSLQAHRRH